MAAHVVRNEKKSHFKMRGRLFFGDQYIKLRATRTIGMKHRIWRSAEVLPPSFLDVVALLAHTVGVNDLYRLARK
jgi:hypothetical protein